MNKKEVQTVVDQFNAIIERKKCTPEERWTVADQRLAKAFIENGFKVAYSYRDRENPHQYFMCVSGPDKCAFFGMRDIFPDILEGEWVNLEYIAEMKQEPVLKKGEK